MITHIPTGRKFDNRLQAKIYFGHSDYNRRCRNREFIFHNSIGMNREIVNVSLPLRDEVKTYTK